MAGKKRKLTVICAGTPARSTAATMRLPSATFSASGLSQWIALPAAAAASTTASGPLLGAQTSTPSTSLRASSAW
jgi:hypothetical protein